MEATCSGSTLVGNRWASMKATIHGSSNSLEVGGSLSRNHLEAIAENVDDSRCKSTCRNIWKLVEVVGSIWRKCMEVRSQKLMEAGGML